MRTFRWRTCSSKVHAQLRQIDPNIVRPFACPPRLVDLCKWPLKMSRKSDYAFRFSRSRVR